MIHSRHERHSLARHGTIFWLIVLIAFFLPSNAVFASATESAGLNIAKEKSSSKDIPIEVKHWFEEAYNAYNRADVNSAVVLYLRVAEWARVNLPQSHPTRALILRNLGMALGMTGRLGEGLKATLEAVRTYQSLAALDSSLAEELATTLDNLSVIYMRMSQWSDMIATAEEAVRIRRDRYRRNATSSNRLGKSLMNLSAFYRRLGRSQEAISTSTEAIAIFRGLAATDPTYRFHLGKTMMNLGAVYFDLGNEEGALTAMREAVSQFRTEGRNDPAAQGNLADALTNLSVISRRIGDKSQSLSYAKQSVQVYLDMTETALQSHWGDAAAALIAVSNAYVALGDTANAVPSAEASVKILRAIANYYPYRKLELAQSLNTLSILYSELGRGNDALLRGRESYQLLVELAKANPAYQETVAVALSTIGNQLLENGDAKGALRVLAESTSMSRSIAFKNPVHLRQLAGVLNTLATLHLQDGDLQQAQALFREALQIASNLSAFNPDHLVAKAQIATNFSRLYLRQAQPSAAISLLHEAVVWDVTSLQLQLPLLSERYRQGFADTFGNRWQLPFSTAQLSQAGAELALFTRLNRQGLLQDTQRNQLFLARNGAHRASLLQLVVLRSGLFNTQIPLAERQKQFAKIESLEYDL